jgi:hypothetical protein
MQRPQVVEEREVATEPDADSISTPGTVRIRWYRSSRKAIRRKTRGSKNNGG